jgi:mRNA interferase HigB
MKAHIIKKKTIEHYVRNNAQSRAGLNTWLNVMKNADWNEPLDIVISFNMADILGKGTNRVVFNIGGNKYRMICSYYFGKTRVHIFIRWIGTHAAYTKLCKEGLQYNINIY